MQNYIDSRQGETVVLKILRKDSKITIEAVPEILPTSNNKAVLGIGLVKTGIVTYPWYLSLWEGIKATGSLIIAMFIALAGLIKSIFATGQMTADIAGPVGIAVLTGQVVEMGIVYVLQFAALLSLNLALINILPFPALDGGRLMFLVIEKIRGREVDARIENIVHTAGFALLMVAVLVITYKDLTRWGGQIIERII